MNNKKITIIAEAGINHNKNIVIAKKMINLAAKAGADIVKFQTAIPENIVTKNAKLAPYQLREIGKKMSQLDMQKNFHFDLKVYKKLMNYSKKKKIEFMSTAFDIQSLNYLIKIGMKKIKIPSGEITNYEFLDEVSKKNKAIYLSTGMSSINDIKNALKILRNKNKKKIYVMHCTSSYPSKFENLNLNVLNSYKNFFGDFIGYSDHSEGIEASIAAAALGAKVIEKHVTLNKNLPGPDQKTSITFDELKKLIKSIRNIEKSLGSKKKKILKCEIPNMKVARRSIVAKSKIFKGEIFTIRNITCKRPMGGIASNNWFKVLGKKAKKVFLKDSFIKL